MKPFPVVIVDDSEIDRYVTSRRLSDQPSIMEVIEAEDGESFLNKMYDANPKLSEKTPPLLVLMDINMPGRDGFETLSEIERRRTEGHGPNEIVVVMCTSSNYELDMRRANDFDCVKGYIVKPLTEDDISLIVSTYQQSVPVH